MLVSCLRGVLLGAREFLLLSLEPSHTPGAGGSWTAGRSPPPHLTGGKLTHMVRLTDFLEVVELVGGGLGPNPPLPGSQSDGLGRDGWGPSVGDNWEELPQRGDERWAKVQPL